MCICEFGGFASLLLMASCCNGSFGSVLADVFEV